jgi:hypothetical protein
MLNRKEPERLATAGFKKMKRQDIFLDLCGEALLIQVKAVKMHRNVCSGAQFFRRHVNFTWRVTINPYSSDLASSISMMGISSFIS